MEKLKLFASGKGVIVVVMAVVGIWVLAVFFGMFEEPSEMNRAANQETHQKAASISPAAETAQAVHEGSAEPAAAAPAKVAKKSPNPIPAQYHSIPTETAGTAHTAAQAAPGHAEEIKPAAAETHESPLVSTSAETTSAHAGPAAAETPPEKAVPPKKGVTFMEACIQPLDYELNERFWGWRPNDIIDFTDNVNNFQLGVLEVTRRTTVILTERISRTGSTAAFDPNLQNAMNWFMIKADSYWFPTPEGKYKDGLKELRIYTENLKKGSERFYSRTDNLIPLLLAYEDLLGSCDDNLVKHNEDDGEPVSHFKADDYFYYAKGVSASLYTILQAILVDFHEVIVSRRGEEVLHHAVESCRQALEVEPLYITNSSLDGQLANHRANLAAPISHARFYVGVLIKALST